MSLSRGTRLGTVASLAGCHIIVASSSRALATNSPIRVSTNGSVTSTSARPMSQATITRLRLSRSTITPTAVARKNPGATRVASTRAMAVLFEPSGASWLARAIVAKSPSQSPVADTTWAIQSLKKSLVPKIRSRRPDGRTDSKASSSRRPAEERRGSLPTTTEARRRAR